MLKRLVPGDVAWAPDIFHDETRRSRRAEPDHGLSSATTANPGQKDGVQYVCLALTSNLAKHDSMILVEPSDWEVGGGGKARQIDSETVQVVKHHWCAQYLGRIRSPRVREARKRLMSWLS